MLMLIEDRIKAESTVSSVSDGIKIEHIVKLFDFSVNSSALVFGSSNSST